jgi:hypothetical protein
MTTEAACLAALRAAAEELGESPTKAAYEELGTTPAASTILRVCGGWNEAKERAGLSTNPSRGPRVADEPADVTIPKDVEWSELTQDQRWHYRNVKHNTQRTLDRRQRLRAWVNERKASAGCARCGEADPRCLDFHHREPGSKRMGISEMVTHGYGTEQLQEEISNCDVLCANCHRREHREAGGSEDGRRATLREWTREYKRTQGCARCDETAPVCLVFHHDGDKRATVARLLADCRPLAEVQAEARSCVVLCGNCHRKEHVELPAVDESSAPE